MLTDLNRDEVKKQAAFYALKNHDEERDEALKHYTRLTCMLLKVPICFVSVLDDEKQYIKSAQNISIKETSLSDAFCVHTVNSGKTLICPDTLQHAVFKDFKLVKHAPFIRFYGGCPIKTREGIVIGTLCILSSQPHTLSDEQVDIFEKMALIVSEFLAAWHAVGHIDIVTLLPNRQRLLKDIASLHEGPFKLTIIDCIDMPFAYEMARSLGMMAVEGLLRDMVVQLQRVLHLPGLLYAVAVGRFAFLTSASENITSEHIVARLQGIQARMNPQIPLDLNIHIGDSGLCSQALTPGEILRRAVSALHEGISQGNRFMTYDAQVDSQKKNDFSLLTDLKKALHGEEGLYLVYQPKVSLITDQVTGVEALLRWRHPQMGDVLPGLFIPLVERTGLMRELTDWVINTSIKQLCLWRDKGLSLPVSINLSASDFSRADFADVLEQKMLSAGLAPGLLGVECLETEKMLESPSALYGLEMLKLRGFKISLDDFGSGYSNINYLRKIPMDIIKLDRSIILNISTDKGSLIIVRNVIKLLKQLDYEVLAEGVEDDLTVEILRSLGCDEVQGYVYSRPLVSDVFETWYYARRAGV
ncbi:EAL domain-containing protein [Ewingella sp. S1.OA.A_B6]